MLKSDLYKNNKFVQEVLDNNVALATRDWKDKRTGRDHLSKKDKFIIDTFQSFHQVTFKIEALDNCIALINSYPKTKLWEKSFLRSEYVRYHMEVYYGNVVGAFDRCLLLTNHLFDLGLQPRDVKYEVIISNNHMKGEELVKLLKIFHKSIQQIRTVRNHIAHQGSFSDKELDEIERYEFILKKSPKIEKKLERTLKVFIKLGFSDYLRKKKKEVAKNNFHIFSILNTLLLSMLGQYRTRIKKLNKNEKK